MARKKKKLTYWQKFRKYASKNPLKAWSLLIGGGFFSIIVLFLLCLTLSVRVGLFGKIPTETELLSIKQDNATIVYGKGGGLLGKYYNQNRTSVDFDEISLPVYDALIATEDSRFFEHQGIDLRAWARVMYRTILMRDARGGGGSTLSQQLAKNLYPRQAIGKLSMPVAKIKEMFTARRLEKAYKKEELLNLYLNTVPFGYQIYGIQEAAQTFFNTDAADLEIEEAAVLVGMLKANTKYNPVRNPKSSLARRNIVLLQMAKYGYIRPSEAEELREKPIELDYQREKAGDGVATYFREHLKQEVKKILKKIKKSDGGKYDIRADGLRIHTSIDANLQRYAEQAVAEHMADLQKQFDAHWKGKKAYGNERTLQEAMERTPRYKRMKAAGASKQEIRAAFEKPARMTVFNYGGDVIKEMSPLDSLKYYYCLLNAGFMAADPNSGKVLAWVGGIDRQYFQYDHVKSRRQAGSIFKPIVYATALQNGVQPCNYIENKLVTYTDYDDWQPHNSDDQYGGVYSMEGAIRSSVNSVAVNLIMQTGIDSVRLLAKAMGVKSSVPNAPSIALGTAEVSLQDMVQVYSTFAAQGVRRNLHYIERIETKSGELIYEAAPEPEERVLSEDNAAIMSHLLQAVVDSGTARRLRFRYQLAEQIAGKTGTTQSQADGWFLGYTPDLVAGAWVGGEYPTVRFRTTTLGQGANMALPIYGKFMQKINQSKKTRHYVEAGFKPLSRNQYAALNCMPYLDEAPLPQDSTEQLDDWYKSLENIFDRIGNKKNKSPRTSDTQTRPRSRDEVDRDRRQSQTQERDRIKKRNEKLKRKKERQRKLKKKLENLFGKKN